tara:strand:+ start:2281 stop:2775 length:495 start_codon:yes stop_codon:yes gene_type:complete
MYKYIFSIGILPALVATSCKTTTSFEGHPVSEDVSVEVFQGFVDYLLTHELIEKSTVLVALGCKQPIDDRFVSESQLIKRFGKYFTKSTGESAIVITIKYFDLAQIDDPEYIIPDDWNDLSFDYYFEAAYTSHSKYTTTIYAIAVKRRDFLYTVERVTPIIIVD